MVANEKGRPASWVDDFVCQPRRLWLSYFGYAVLVAGLVQLVVLPYIFPGIHDGHGLLVEGDWVRHHQVTADLARRIHEEGWSTWEFRPGGEHALNGINSAVYALTVPEPWTLIPLQAALHATSTLLLVYILRLFVSSWGVAVVGALSFLLFPSSLITFAQISKDAYSICGGFVFLYGWLLLARWPERSSWRRMIGIVALIMGGATLTWTTRPYLVEVMQGISVGFATLLMVRNAAASIRRAMLPSQGVLASAMAWLIVALLIPFESLGSELYFVGSDGYLASSNRMSPAAAIARLTEGPPATQSEPEEPPATQSEPEEPPATQSEAQPLSIVDVALTEVDPTVTLQWLSDHYAAIAAARARSTVPWNNSWWLPAAIDDRLFSLVALRNRWEENEGGSTVDQDVMPESPGEVLAYLPRLLAVGFLAPFPGQWFEDGSFESTSIMRRAVGIEMMLVYVTWVGLALSIWRWRASLELWFILAYGGVHTLALAFTIPNIGSLQRARYGFLMVLVALGIAGATSILSRGRIDKVARVRH